jgi:hypothetical protein
VKGFLDILMLIVYLAFFSLAVTSKGFGTAVNSLSAGFNSAIKTAKSE